MDTDNGYLQLAKDNLLIIVCAVIGLSFLGYGIFQILAPKESSSGIVIQKAESADTSVKNISPTTTDIVIDVEGAVEKPGIYHLPATARQQDALIAAGGMSKAADRSMVAKSLNMAAKLADGMKLYIPHVGESAAVMTNSGTQQVAGAETSIISVNSASATDLDSLPGIGPVTAAKIISNRPYGSLDDLVSKKSVTKSVFDKIKDQISL